METLSVSIRIIVDTIAEKTEMFSVMLRTSSQRRGISLFPAKANIIIVDDDGERRRRVDYIDEGREGEREGGTEGGREGGREEGREGRRAGAREGGLEGHR